MKDQYVGDVNDYFKYGLLRSIQRHERSPVVVCWMKTPDDGTSDGRRRAYVTQPEQFRAADPPLFDEMRRLCRMPRPRLSDVEAAKILPRAAFFSRVLEDSREHRSDFFDRFARTIAPGSTIFLDPDNGLEVKSVPKGRRGSCKYIYLDELAMIAQHDVAIVVYQHFGRVKRDAYINEQLDRLRRALGCPNVLAVAGAHIAFFIVTTAMRTHGFEAALDALIERWPALTSFDLRGRISARHPGQDRARS